MNVSPLDLRQTRFRTTLRGFDKVEVTSLLTAVADDYEQALRETDRLRQELANMETVLNEHREHEKNLRATLMTAQQLSDDIKANAQKEAERIEATATKEAERILRDAETRSQLLLDRTQVRLEDIQHEIDGLKLKRRDVETSLEGTIQTLRNTLDYIRDLEARERDEKMRLQRTRLDAPIEVRESLDQHSAHA
jgi:cell division initiation protein